MGVLLGAAYFPPVEYFAAIAEGMVLSKDGVIPSVVYIEACENYQKQSYRNRCRIFSANGVEDLHFPIVHRGGGAKIPISEVEIDYSTDWVTRHKRAILSAYRTSAFFEYYQDELFAILDSKPKTLMDLDLQLMRFFLEKTGLKAEIRFTEDYIRTYPEEIRDLREVIHPKRQNSILQDLGLEKEYFQVFGPRYGFTRGLSIMDLLFNEGRNSITYLKRLDQFYSGLGTGAAH